MRRKDREVTDLQEILAIMKKCDICRLALNDDGYPYIIPLNFGLEVLNDTITLYFHSALEGHKVDLIKKDNRASFEMDCDHLLKYNQEKGTCTMCYESVIGQGTLRILDASEKVSALQKLMTQYHGDKEVLIHPGLLERTLVYALDVTAVSGKKNKP